MCFAIKASSDFVDDYEWFFHFATQIRRINLNCYSIVLWTHFLNHNSLAVNLMILSSIPGGITIRVRRLMCPMLLFMCKLFFCVYYFWLKEKLFGNQNLSDCDQTWGDLLCEIKQFCNQIWRKKSWLTFFFCI